MTGDDLVVRWDGVSTAEVWLSEYHQDNVCGLCGDFNDHVSDDQLKRDGRNVSECSFYFWNCLDKCPIIFMNISSVLECYSYLSWS